jgi:hypothetical protein
MASLLRTTHPRRATVTRTAKRLGRPRSRYGDVFGERTRSGNRPWLIKRIAWRLQANTEGGLSERALQRAEELARDADLRLRPPAEVRSVMPANAPPANRTIPFKSDQRLPAVGTVLVRRYKGDNLQARVLADGFEYDGEVHSSLSAVERDGKGSFRAATALSTRTG